MSTKAKERRRILASLLLYTSMSHWPNLQRCQRTRRLINIVSSNRERGRERYGVSMKANRPRCAPCRLQETLCITLINTLQQFWVVWGHNHVILICVIFFPCVFPYTHFIPILSILPQEFLQDVKHKLLEIINSPYIKQMSKLVADIMLKVLEEEGREGCTMSSKQQKGNTSKPQREDRIHLSWKIKDSYATQY